MPVRFCVGSDGAVDVAVVFFLLIIASLRLVSSVMTVSPSRLMSSLMMVLSTRCGWSSTVHDVYWLMYSVLSFSLLYCATSSL